MAWDVLSRDVLSYILFLYNVDTLNICMKEFGSEKIIFDKMTAVRS